MQRNFFASKQSFMLIKEEKQTAQMDIQDSFVLLVIMRKKK